MIRRPPVMAPRPKKKKSGLILWVIIAVVVAALVGVAIWGFVDGWLPELFSGSGTSNSGDEGEENEDPYADWNEFEIDGLIVYLPEGFEKEENRGRITAFYRESRTDYVEIEVEHDTVEELSADIEDAEDLADYYIDEIEADDDVVHEYETMNGVPYVIFSREDDPEDVMVLGFYSDGEMYWVLCAENFDPDDVEEIVPLITSGKVKKSSDDRDDAQDKKDSDTGRNEYELNGLLIYLPDEFDEGDSDENVAFFSGDDVEIRIESMPMSEESIKNADDMAEYFYDHFCDSYEDEIEDNELTVELKKKNGVPYVIMLDDTKVAVIGLYTDGETGWDVAVKCEDPERAEEMIEYATGCELG